MVNMCALSKNMPGYNLVCLSFLPWLSTGVIPGQIGFVFVSLVLNGGTGVSCNLSIINCSCRGSNKECVNYECQKSAVVFDTFHVHINNNGSIVCMHT